MGLAGMARVGDGLRRVRAERYAGALREGGSLPLLVVADDGERYVVKMRGAGQGTLALAAEVISGEIARRLGLRVPAIAVVELDPLFGRQEHDAEIRDLLRRSTGGNAGLRFLEGATTFDRAAGDTVTSELASRVVWADAFLMNVDRTPRNPNLMQWQGETWLIDHGASLYFQHDWESAGPKALSPFTPIREHVLLPWATEIGRAGEEARAVLSEAVLREVVALVPGDWLGDGEVDQARERYVRFLSRRLGNTRVFEEEVERARTDRV